MNNLKEKNYLQILFLLSILILTSALVIEYVFGFKPCSLCIIERIPYGLAIITLILNYNFKKNQVFFQYFINITFFFFISYFIIPL